MTSRRKKVRRDKCFDSLDATAWLARSSNVKFCFTARKDQNNKTAVRRFYCLWVEDITLLLTKQAIAIPYKEGFPGY